jgi:multiple sugar transport system permease protein
MRRTLTGLLFISPWLLGFLLLVVYPFAASLYWSFCRYDLLSAPQFVGLENYRRLAEEFIAGETFGKAVWNTAYYAAVSVPLSIAMGLGLAVMLSWDVRGRAIYRTLFFLPSVIPVVASSILWMWLLDPQRGLINYLLSHVGIPPQNWFKGVGEAAWLPGWWNDTGGCGAKDALALMSVWGVGNFMVIYLAALGDVPRELYEAAELDGAGRWRRFRQITLPQLSPVIFFNLVMGLIHAVQAFTQVYLVSEGRGEPAESALLLSLHLFLAAFQNLDMGYASAMAWLLFVMLLVVTAMLFHSSRRWVFYRAGSWR